MYTGILNTLWTGTTDQLGAGPAVTDGTYIYVHNSTAGGLEQVTKIRISDWAAA